MNKHTVDEHDWCGDTEAAEEDVKFIPIMVVSAPSLIFTIIISASCVFPCNTATDSG